MSSMAMDTKTPSAERIKKLRLWRQRVLLKKGARLHAKMLANADGGSLAMLDEDGVVVSWYGESPNAMSAGLIGHHVSQFYLNSDITLGVPARDLRTAALHGSSKQQGWRRAASGRVDWTTTHIQSELLADGRLQGFTHVIRLTPGGADARTNAAQPPLARSQPRRASKSLLHFLPDLATFRESYRMHAA
jgi:hypothetical protein